jgi:hypothetical protein
LTACGSVGMNRTLNAEAANINTCTVSCWKHFCPLRREAIMVVTMGRDAV